LGQIHTCEVSLRRRRETSGNGEDSETEREFRGREKLWGKRLGTNKKTKLGLKAWIPASAGMTEKRDFGGRGEFGENTSLGSHHHTGYKIEE